ncbi:MAG: peptidoglycan recognition family protein [Planctomycetota bacterium]
MSGGSPARPSSDGYSPYAAGKAPAWSTQPHSWGKLDAIERWLQTSPRSASSTQRDGYWRLEGQLQLAEGQLRFAQEAAAQRDRSASNAAENLVAFRKASSMSGFEAVLNSPDSTGEQKTRARRGLQTARRIRGGPALNTAEAAAPAIPIGGLVSRSAWSASRADANNMRRATGSWEWITVHHSVFAPSTGQLADSLDVVRRIQRQHIDVENYADIGYHFLIDREGRVIEGRRLRWQGAHAGDSAKNRGNVGICLLGNFEVEHPTPKALASLDRLVLELQRKLRIPRPNVRPHSAWKETACPGRHLMPWFTRR